MKEGKTLKKISSDSWVDNIEVNNKNFLGRKTVDYSMLNYGTIIPIRYYNKFLENLSSKLERGNRVKIDIVLNGDKYPGSIDMPDVKKRKTAPIRINYTDKLLKEILQKEFQSSYEYILDYEKKNDKKPNTIPDEYKEYIDFYKGDELDTFIINLLPINSQGAFEEDNKGIYCDDEEIESEDIEVNNEFWNVTNIKEEIEYIYNYISRKGFNYSKELVENLYLSIKTKPFVILSGISGTGKSKIVQLFSEAIGANYDNGRFKLIPVKPDWSDATDLLGYRNIEGKFTPGIITLAAYESMKNPENPYFICLDEMNLARVEYYFSDILSLMETKRLDGNGNIVTEKLISKEQFGRDTASFDKYGDVYIPQNLYIIGTVNMDETTFPFSKKVLDRANTIEFNKVDLNYNFEQIFNEEIEERIYHNDFLKANYLKIAECKDEKEIAIKVIDKLISINNILENYNQHFGFRVRDEIVFYMIYAIKNNIMDFDKALDYCIVQKILPKINGSNSDVLEILVKIFNFLNNSTFNCENYLDDISIREMTKKSKESDYKLSSEKLMYMIRRFVKDGFTSFWQ